MAPFDPVPQPPMDVVIQFAKCLLGYSIAVVVGPAQQARVELSQERLLGEAHSRVNQLADLLSHCLDLAPGLGDQQFIPMFAHGVPQKVEALADVSQDSLLL